MWEPKLPNDYKEIIQQSLTPGICDTEKKKDLYDMLCEGILIQKSKVVNNSSLLSHLIRLSFSELGLAFCVKSYIKI